MAIRDWSSKRFSPQTRMRPRKPSVANAFAHYPIQEKQYEDEHIDFHGSTIQLHKLSRHWLTLCQDCTDFNVQLRFLNEAYICYTKTVGAQSKAWSLDMTVDMGESFEMLMSQCDTCVRWTRQYHERTNIRINLVINDVFRPSLLSEGC